VPGDEDWLFAASGTGGVQELVVTVPEPATVSLMLLGVCLLAARSAHRRRAAIGFEPN
jgi:hypothetical protein